MLNNIAALLTGGAAASTSSYESIATATGTGSSGVITFSSIPSTYKHLQIRAISQDTNTNDFSASYDIRFNSDTGSNYSRHWLGGEGATVYASGNANYSYIRMENASTRSFTANTMGASIIDIFDYASTSKAKTVKAITGTNNNSTAADSYFITLQSGAWYSTSAIDSITLIAGNSFTTRTQFALYGIKG